MKSYAQPVVSVCSLTYRSAILKVGASSPSLREIILEFVGMESESGTFTLSVRASPSDSITVGSLEPRSIVMESDLSRGTLLPPIKALFAFSKKVIDKSVPSRSTEDASMLASVTVKAPLSESYINSPFEFDTPCSLVVPSVEGLAKTSKYCEKLP